jgi:hypothetical protein
MTRRDLALHLLREAGSRGITTAEFLRAGVGSRYSARIMELRQAGHVIEAERIREGSWRYVLTHDAAVGAGEHDPNSFPASADQSTDQLFELPREPRSAALHDHEEEAA